jgi:DNA topoisomerase-1
MLAAKAKGRKSPAKARATARKPAAAKPASGRKAPATTKTGRLRASAVRVIKAAEN